MESKKRFTVAELAGRKAGKVSWLAGWVEKKRVYKSVLFLDFRDGSGNIQLVAKKENLGDDKFSELGRVNPESCIKVEGSYNPSKPEVEIGSFTIISPALKTMTPEIDSDFNIFDSRYSDVVTKKKHLYLRNPTLRSIFRARSHFLEVVSGYLSEQGFTNFEPPMFTDITLYGADSAFGVTQRGKTSYLNQCSAFYLEAAIPSFEKVYSITPSFRRDPSTGKRHLAEYWHLKGEIAFMDLEGMMEFVEQMIYGSAKGVGERIKEDANIKMNEGITKPPYPVLDYKEAVERLKAGGFKMEFGKSLSNEDELFLSKEIRRPFWVKYLPRSVEPFPYRINPNDERTTLTADLVVPGFGEVLGVAEKIHDKKELDRRMKEDFVPHTKDTYRWYSELREFGLPPHSGFGIGIERLLRAFLSLDHVKFAIPFPRLYDHPFYP